MLVTRRRRWHRCPLRSPRGSLAAPGRAGVQEAAPRMGVHEWPRRPLLCIIVTQAISCLEVWEKGEKKNPEWGKRELGGGEYDSRGPGAESGRRLSPAP